MFFRCQFVKTCSDSFTKQISFKFYGLYFMLRGWNIKNIKQAHLILLILWKNKISSRNVGGFGMRRALVVFQFFITQFLIICTIVVIWQTQYMKQFDMGFLREAIVLVNLPENDKGKIAGLVNSLSAHNSIKNVSVSGFAPASGATMATAVNFVGSSEQYRVEMKMIDPNYLALYGIKLLA